MQIWTLIIGYFTKMAYFDSGVIYMHRHDKDDQGGFIVRQACLDFVDVVNTEIFQAHLNNYYKLL